MARVTLHTSDPVILDVYDEQKTTEYFGEEEIQECGIEIPDELLIQYQKNIEEFWKIQAKLMKLK